MRSRAVVALIGLVFALGACQSLPGQSRPSRLQGILDSDTLRVGTTGEQPPLNMKNASGEIVGFEPDLVSALGEAMGMHVEFVLAPFAELLPMLERGDVDLVVSGMTITPQRNRRVAFAGPYFISGMSVLARSDTVESVERPTDLDQSDRTYAALEGSTSADFVRRLLPKAKLVTTKDYDTAVQMVIDGSADGMIADYLRCALSAWEHPEQDLATLATPFTVEPLGIAIPANAPLLLNLVQNYLNTLENTGLLTRFKAKWLADGEWMTERR